MNFLFILFYLFPISFALEKSPKILEVPKQTELLWKTTHVILCNLAAGTKPVFFEWHKDGQKIVANKNIRIENSEFSSILMLMNLDSISSGIYNCNARNAFGSDTVTTRIIVKGFP